MSGQSFGETIAHFVHKIGQSIAAHAEYRWLQEQSPETLEAIAHDVGLSVGDLEEAMQSDPDSMGRVAKMMAQFHINKGDVAKFAPSTERDIIRLCSQCEHKSRCDHELEAGTAAEHAHEFCLNASAFEECCANREKAHQ